jgi:hypothetical protein
MPICRVPRHVTRKDQEFVRSCGGAREGLKEGEQTLSCDLVLAQTDTVGRGGLHSSSIATLRMVIPAPTGMGTRPLTSVSASRIQPFLSIHNIRKQHGVSRRPSRLVVLAESNLPTPNAAVRAVNRIKLLIDDTPALSNAKKRLWGWAAGK